MKRNILLIVSIMLAGAAAYGQEDGKTIPGESKARYVKDLKKIFPEFSSLKYEQDYIFSVNDGKGGKLGYLYLEPVRDADREYGYSGTIELGLAFDLDKKVAGLVVGRNVESASYLARVRRKLNDSWNKLEMKGVLNHKVDAVSGATHTSSAIIVSVRKLARAHLKSDTPIIIAKPEPVRSRNNGAGAPEAMRGRRGNDGSKERKEINDKIEQLVLQYRKEPSEQVKTELKTAVAKQTDNEIAEFTRRANMLNRIVTMSDLLLKQWQSRQAEEVEMRTIGALDGRKAAMAYGKEKKMIYFVHPGSGGSSDEEMDALVKKYKDDPSAANREAVKKLVTEKFELQLETVPQHNRDQEKAYEGTKAYLENLTANKEQVIEKRLNAFLEQYNKTADKRTGMKFKSAEAQAQKQKIQELAKNYRETRTPEALAVLRKEVVKQLVTGVAAMSAKIAETKDKEYLKKHLDALLADPEAVIQSRLDSLTKEQ